MRITEMDLLFAYNGWANARVLKAAQTLSEDDLVRTDIVSVPCGSLRGTWIHILSEERAVRLQLSRNIAAEPLDETSYTTVSQISQAMRAEATAMKDYLIGLEDEHMDSHITMEKTGSTPYWQVLMHVLQHSAHHRSEASVLLRTLDRAPESLDFSAFLQESR
jgi:uncharacterized damage-inducible protein DinB